MLYHSGTILVSKDLGFTKKHLPNLSAPADRMCPSSAPENPRLRWPVNLQLPSTCYACKAWICNVIIMLSSCCHQLLHWFANGMWQLDCPNIFACRKSRARSAWPGRGWPLALCCWSLTSTSCWHQAEAQIASKRFDLGIATTLWGAAWMCAAETCRNHQKPQIISKLWCIAWSSLGRDSSPTRTIAPGANQKLCESKDPTVRQMEITRDGQSCILLSFNTFKMTLDSCWVVRSKHCIKLETSGFSSSASSNACLTSSFRTMGPATQWMRIAREIVQLYNSWWDHTAQAAQAMPNASGPESLAGSGSKASQVEVPGCKGRRTSFHRSKRRSSRSSRPPARVVRLLMASQASSAGPEESSRATRAGS